MKIKYALYLGLICSAFACATSVKEMPQEKTFVKQQKDSVMNQNCDSIWDKLKESKADTLRVIRSIPENFDAALDQLDSLIGNPMKAWIRCLPDQEFGDRVHHGLGTNLRNNWGLWKNSVLAKNLRSMGMIHPDDMTAIIFDSYQRKLKGQDIRLKEQIKYYDDFWHKSDPVADSLRPSK